MVNVGYSTERLERNIPRDLRLARAQCLKDICSKDASKALTLIAAIQEALHDSDPAVHSLGIKCIAELCEADVLEFYASWRVVSLAA